MHRIDLYHIGESFSVNFFCNTKVARLGEILSSRIFHVFGTSCCGNSQDNCHFHILSTIVRIVWMKVIGMIISFCAQGMAMTKEIFLYVYNELKPYYYATRYEKRNKWHMEIYSVVRME